MFFTIIPKLWYLCLKMCCSSRFWSSCTNIPIFICKVCRGQWDVSACFSLSGTVAWAHNKSTASKSYITLYTDQTGSARVSALTIVPTPPQHNGQTLVALCSLFSCKACSRSPGWTRLREQQRPYGPGERLMQRDGTCTGAGLESGAKPTLLRWKRVSWVCFLGAEGWMCFRWSRLLDFRFTWVWSRLKGLWSRGTELVRSLLVLKI